MTSPIPVGMSTNGTILALFVPTIASPAAPTVTELTAGTVVDLSCYITGDGLSTEVSENSVEDPRLCSKQVFEARGDFSNTLELTYVYNTTSAPDDEARIALAPGTAGYIVLRYGLDSDEAIAAADLVDVYPVEMGAQRKNTPARNSVHTISQKPFITGTVHRDVAVQAGV